MVDHSGKPIQNQHPMQHMTFEESLGESGYSTPNSRSRRIIREIIVWKWNAASDFLMDKTTHSHLLKEFYFKNSDEDDMKKNCHFLIWKNVEKSVITLFSSLTLKKNKNNFFDQPYEQTQNNRWLAGSAPASPDFTEYSAWPRKNKTKIQNKYLLCAIVFILMYPSFGHL